MRRTHLRWLPVVLLVSAGCFPRVEGTLEIDGEAVKLQKCASAEHAGIGNAIDLTTSKGEFRVAVDADNQAQISYLVSAAGTILGIPVGGQTTVTLSGCGPMTLKRADYKQNEVYPLSGSATLDCQNFGTNSAEEHSFRGQITFENCR